MEPMYLHGDQILVEYCEEIHPGEVGVFNVGGTEAVMRLLLRDGRLHSINPEYGDVIPRDVARLIGKVSWRVTEDMRSTREQEKLYWEAVEEKKTESGIDFTLNIVEAAGKHGSLVISRDFEQSVVTAPVTAMAFINHASVIVEGV